MAHWCCDSAPAASPTADANGGRSIPPSLYTRSGGRQTGTYIPKALHHSVRQAVDNGRRLKRLLEEVSQENLRALVQQKQALSRSKDHIPAEDPGA